MTKTKFQRIIRKSHRYLGLVLGIQFLFWTVGGLYFSWTKIEEIRGENLRRKESLIDPAQFKASLADIIQSLQIDSLVKVDVASILGTPHYQLTILKDDKRQVLLANTRTGEIRNPINQTEAIQIASNAFLQPVTVKNVSYLTTALGHHEYWEKPLPAYAVTLNHPTNTTVYVSANLGTVQSFRNNQWRIFDFLWMLHVMDFKNRDNINNWLLRVFSAFGLVTIFSGFALYIVSSRSLNRRHRIE